MPYVPSPIFSTFWYFSIVPVAHVGWGGCYARGLASRTGSARCVRVGQRYRMPGGQKHERTATEKRQSQRRGEFAAREHPEKCWPRWEEGTVRVDLAGVRVVRPGGAVGAHVVCCSGREVREAASWRAVR